MSLDPDGVDLHVGARVRWMRIMRNLTQEELGSRIGVSYQQIQKYETASNRISVSRLFRIASVFAVEPGWFFEGLPIRAVDGEDVSTTYIVRSL